MPDHVHMHGVGSPHAARLPDVGAGPSLFSNPQSYASAHDVVDEDGTVYQCVAEQDSA
jgi:N-acetyl-anhydromuramyl-L-alanine amidase AmpD